MKHLINKFVKSIGASIILRSKKFDGALTYYLVDWIGTDSQYYSLLAISNDTQLLTKNVLLLGECDSDYSVNPLLYNLRQSDTKADWLLDRWDVKEVDKMDAFLKHRIQWIKSYDFSAVNCNGYSILGVSLVLRPVFEYVVSYIYEDCVKTLVLPMGMHFSIESESKDHYEFLSSIIQVLGLGSQFSITGEHYDYAN